MADKADFEPREDPRVRPPVVPIVPNPLFALAQLFAPLLQKANLRNNKARTYKKPWVPFNQYSKRNRYAKKSYKSKYKKRWVPYKQYIKNKKYRR